MRLGCCCLLLYQLDLQAGQTSSIHCPHLQKHLHQTLNMRPHTVSAALRLCTAQFRDTARA